MKKKLLFLCLLLLLPIFVQAKRGCCSHHGGVAGCSPSGRQICADGTLSPSCTCNPPIVYGCMDSKADNYNRNANRSDGSCRYTIYGCMDKQAINFNKNANTSDGSCLYEKEEKEVIDIDYETIYEESEALNSGEEKIINEGVIGKEEITYLIKYDERGKELSKKVKSIKKLAEPQNQIIARNNKNKNLNRSKMENEEPVYLFIGYTCLFLITRLFAKHHHLKSIFDKLKSQKHPFKHVVYFFYFALIFPVFIDITWMIKQLFMGKTAN